VVAKVFEQRFSRKHVARAVSAAVMAGLLVGALTSATPAATTGTSVPLTHTSASIQFRNEMRELWGQHVTWTRLFIVSFDAGLPDLDATTHRLLRNQVDIGDAVKPFYGDAAGDRLTALLKRHIVLAAEVVAAAKAGNDAALDDALDAWYANARRIARFLHAANPDNWPLEDLRMMMREHLDLTLTEASDYLAGRYGASAHDLDAVETEILHMADMLSIGIIRQFPSRFSA
jgi:hypothetical protein